MQKPPTVVQEAFARELWILASAHPIDGAATLPYYGSTYFDYAGTGRAIDVHKYH